MSETETLIGTMTGAAAARWLNSYGSAPPSFASLVFTGPVDTLTGPVTVVSGAPGSVMGFGGLLHPAGLPSGGICPLCGFRCWPGAGCYQMDGPLYQFLLVQRPIDLTRGRRFPGGKWGDPG